MHRTNLFASSLLFVLPALSCACSGGEANDPASHHSPTIGATVNTPRNGGDGDSTSASLGGSGGEEIAAPVGPYEIYEDFTIPLNLEVTVGSFIFEFKEAEVDFREDTVTRPTIRFPFSARNQSGSAQVPLTNQSGDLVLDLGDDYIYGKLAGQEKTPGSRTSEAYFWFELKDPTLTPEMIQTAILTIGSGQTNQVVVPLDNPEEAVTLADIPLPAVEVEGLEYGLSLDFDKNRVQFGSMSHNELYTKNTAVLILSGEALGGSEWTCLKTYRFLISREGEAAWAAKSGSDCYIGRSEKTDYGVTFELEQPLAGTYHITILDYDGSEEGAVRFDVTIPE